MRELKFRAYSKNIKEYMREVAGSIANVINILGDLLSQGNWVVEQYTGLKDRNGKEIYEGDIVKFTEKTAEDESTLYKVVWDDFLTGYDLINLERSKADVGYLNKYNIEKHFEVIGNVYENPELLGEQ